MMNRLILAAMTMMIVGCGTSRAVLDRPYSMVVVDLQRLYPPPTPFSGHMEDQLPAYRAASNAAYDVEVNQKQAVAGRVYHVSIVVSEKFQTRHTLITATALDGSRTEVTVDTDHRDSFMYESRKRDWHYQQDRLAEIRHAAASK